MRRLVLAAVLAASLSPLAAHADPQCFPPRAVYTANGWVYVNVPDGPCHWTTYSFPLVGPDATPAADACYAKPLLHQDGDTLYVSVQTGRCSSETVAIPFPIHS